jgi:enterochelin esterase family protein
VAAYLRPAIEAVDGAYRVTFWWRDPAGNETSSAIQRVWIYITGVTDHHQNAVPQSLRRIPGTDAWCWQTTLSPTWRGSYCFIPPTATTIFPQVFNGDSPDRALLREGWRRLLPQAIADPLNPQSWKGGRGHAVSALEMPDAPEQPGWALRDEPYPPPLCIEWHSQRLGNRRRIWVYTTGEAQPQSARWRSCSMASSGPKACRYGRRWRADPRKGLPPAVYLLIDAIDNRTAAAELPCNPDFWLAVQEELLPLVHRLRLSATAPIARWWRAELWRPGDVRRAQLAAALWLRAQPVRLLLVAASRRRADGLLIERLSRANYIRTGCASGWKPVARADYFSRQSGATGASGTADDFLASG